MRRFGPERFRKGFAEARFSGSGNSQRANVPESTELPGSYVDFLTEVLWRGTVQKLAGSARVVRA
jgi:hypothetical protein